MQTYIEKQCIIHKLLDNKRCFDLRNDIKKYLFVDTVYAESRRRKNELIADFKEGIIKYENDGNDYENSSHWAIQHQYSISVQLQALHCNACGEYRFTGSQLSYRATCLCY